MRSRLGLGRNTKQVWDNLFLIMAMLVIISSVLALIFGAANPWVYALCFFIAATMQVCRGSSLLCPDDKHKREFVWAILVYITAIALIVLGLIATGIFG